MDSLERIWNTDTFVVSIFPSANLCFAVQESMLIVRIKAGDKHTVDKDETSVTPCWTAFRVRFDGKFVRDWMFQSRDVFEAITHRAGDHFVCWIEQHTAEIEKYQPYSRHIHLKSSPSFSSPFPHDLSVFSDAYSEFHDFLGWLVRSCSSATAKRASPRLLHRGRQRSTLWRDRQVCDTTSPMNCLHVPA